MENDEARTHSRMHWFLVMQEVRACVLLNDGIVAANVCSVSGLDIDHGLPQAHLRNRCSWWTISYTCWRRACLTRSMHVWTHLLPVTHSRGHAMIVPRENVIYDRQAEDHVQVSAPSFSWLTLLSNPDVHSWSMRSRWTLTAGIMSRPVIDIETGISAISREILCRCLRSKTNTYVPD